MAEGRISDLDSVMDFLNHQDNKMQDLTVKDLITMHKVVYEDNPQMGDDELQSARMYYNEEIERRCYK